MRRIFRKGVMAMAYYRQCTRRGCSLDTGEGAAKQKRALGDGVSHRRLTKTTKTTTVK